MSPMIMNVAVPLPKHSPMFGQEASSQTVCSRCSRRMRLISKKRGDDGARTRIHGGLRRGSVATTLIGIRAVLPVALCLMPAAFDGIATKAGPAALDDISTKSAPPGALDDISTKAAPPAALDGISTRSAAGT